MPSILVVEQEERYVERIRAALSSEGWRVRVVPRADQAIQAAASEAPDLVMVSAEVPAAGTLAGAFSRSGGGPGVVGLLPEGAAFPAPGFTADDLLAKPFSDEDLRAVARRTLGTHRPAPTPAPAVAAPSPPPPISQGEQKLTSRDIFGDVLAEMEDDSPPPAAAPASAAPPPLRPAAATPAPRPAPPPPGDDEVQRRLEKTLSGMLAPEPRPRPAAPPAPPAAAAPAPPPRRAEAPADNVDALLSKTLSNLDLGRTKTGVRPPPAPAPPTPAPPAPAPPPVAAAPAPAPPPRPIPPPAAAPAPVAEGTGVRKPRPQMVGDFDFSELEELARSGRASSPAPTPTPPPRPAAPPVAAAPAPAPPSPAPASLPFQPPPAAPAVAPPPSPAFSLADPLADVATTQRIPVFADEPGDGERFGQYRLLERIAVGGMAEVWKARMRGVEGFQKTVAIKKILPHMTDNTEFVGMFIDEAKLAAQLNHPNIVHIYDLGKIGRDYYIAMEYVEGKDLRSLLNAGRHKGLPLPLGLALMIAARVASALDYAHRKRDFEDREMELVHRDVSPQNVLLTYEGDVKLCDFGIAKAVSKASHTQMGALKGKLQYMSPEQAWGRPVDARSDLFSLGSVLFEMVTGDRLFSGDSEISVLEAVRQGRVRSPRQVSPSVPAEVDEIVVRALAVDPQSRFQTAGEMKQRLEAALATLALPHGPTDLAAYIHRALEPDAAPVEAALPEEPVPVSWSSGPALPASPAPVVEIPAEVPMEMMEMGVEAPVAPVAPVGEVIVEEGGRKSRTLLYAAIAALLVVAVLTFWFLSRRKGTEPQSPPETSAQSQGATPAPVPAASAPLPGGAQATPATAAPAANVQAIVDQKLAQQEEAMRKKLEQQQKDLEKQLAAAKASGTPLPAAAVPAPAPAQTPAVRPPDPVPSPPAPEPEPQREPDPPKAQEKAPPPAPEPVKPAPAAPRVREGDLVSMGAGVAPPQLVSFPKAEYPPLARRLRVEGVVVVSVLVDENGQVQEARLEEPIEQKVGINEAALSAARSARYKPATKEGVRVKMWTRLRIPFKL